jgi:hypothetical protein
VVIFSTISRFRAKDKPRPIEKAWLSLPKKAVGLFRQKGLQPAAAHPPAKPSGTFAG